MKVLDPGHLYELLTLDGKKRQTLRFVKRCDLKNPERFPGNFTRYSGTNMQSVIRCLIERIDYLQNQISHRNNIAIHQRLLECLWLLEDRAAERHGLDFDFRVEDMTELPMCSECGHVTCKHKREKVPTP